VAWVAASIAGPVRAQTPGGEPEQSSAEPAPKHRIWVRGVGQGFQKGTWQAGFTLGGGFGFQFSRYQEKHDLALGTLHVGRTLGENWEVLGELFGGVQFRPTDRTVVGITSVIRYNVATGSRWVPFVDAGVGFSYTSIRDGDLSTPYEFNLQLGGGSHYFIGNDRALTLQSRWLHLSNASLKEPNHGANTLMFFAGNKFF
jgi:hypothetical protein